MQQLGVWVILVLVGGSFGLMFGLDPQNITFGSRNNFARVHGTTVGPEDFTYQRSAIAQTVRIPADERMQQLMGVREEVLDATVERLVLNEAADDLDLAAEERDAEMLTRDGLFIVLGNTVSWLGNKAFNYDVFQQGLLRTLKVSEPRYLEIQRQELLARAVRDLVGSTVVLSDAELRREYDRSANKLSLRYVKFANSSFSLLHDPTAAEIEAYVAANGEALDAQYTRQVARFTKLPAQRRLRILKTIAPASDDEASTQARSAAKARVQDALRRIRGGEDFRRVAREVSEDRDTARSGGDFGWANLAGTGSGLDPRVDEAARALEVGQTSDVVVGEDGFYLVMVADAREGDVPREKAIRELAAELVSREQGKALARQAAEEALLELRGGSKLAALFKAPDALNAGGGIEELPLGGLTTLDRPDDTPNIKVTGLFARDATIPGLGALPSLTEAAWAGVPNAEFIDQVFETPDGVVVAGVERKETGSDEDFAAQRGDLYNALQRAKQQEVSARWARRRCLDARGRGAIVPIEQPIKALLTYGDPETGEPVPGMRPYQICDRVGGRGQMLRLGALGGGLGR